MWPQWLPKEIDVNQLFENTVRCCESDEALANWKAEREWQDKYPSTPLALVCLAHKLHGVTEKTVRTLLCLMSGSNLARLQSSLAKLVPARVEVLYETNLSEDAKSYRQKCLQLWLPFLPARKRAVVCAMAGTILNGDWRAHKKIQHCCSAGCCAGLEDTVTKAQHSLATLLRILRVGTISRSNWASWALPLSSVGLMTSVHGLLPDVFQMAFSQSDVPPGGNSDRFPSSL